MQKNIGERNEIKLAVMAEKIDGIERDIKDIKDSIHELNRNICSTYVTKEEFGPYRKALNIAAGLILGAIVSALLALTIRQEL